MSGDSKMILDLLTCEKCGQQYTQEYVPNSFPIRKLCVSCWPPVSSSDWTLQWAERVVFKPRKIRGLR